MPDNVNWNAVMQSVIDTWLPLIGVVVAAVVIVIIVRIIKKRRRK